MASTNKTPNLNLNSWVGTDQPTRTDFVYDNTTIDTALGGHISDSDIHVTSAQKTKISQPFIVDTIMGNGNATKTINLPFAPSLVIYYQKDYPFTGYNSSSDYTICRAGIVGLVSGFSSASLGLSLSGSTLTVSQSTTTPSAGGNFINLNENGGQYGYVAFR